LARFCRTMGVGALDYFLRCPPQHVINFRELIGHLLTEEASTSSNRPPRDRVRTERQRDFCGWHAPPPSPGDDRVSASKASGSPARQLDLRVPRHRLLRPRRTGGITSGLKSAQPLP